MKTLKLIAAGIILLVTSTTTQAQVSVNVNIGTPPAWGPVGYSNVDFYYIPDIEAYYDIRLAQFIYFGNGRWIHSRYLPVRYRDYDLYRGYKVVLNDYHGRTPYVYYKTHKAKYYRGYKGKPQKSIGVYRNDYGHDNRRDFDRGNDRGNNYNKHNSGNNNHDRGNGNGNGKGKH
ncbi:hypothetical protein EOD40_12130 [Flavobacterium sufflavum]|uniref:DUF3300 domain-containing protein n=1 Tax=Flavobacterium sufflavum TaxID=1921138 RepID=A0A3S2U485_9FLAO|nr:hypothetical protein [Flavobacterium sufflavum]RVT74914.1 hypothetical protein EOD40_12130 [Flavobacterium sufflavum]